MAGLFEKVTSASFDRRTFLQGAAVATASAAWAANVGVASEGKVAEKPESVTLPDPDAEGTWVPVACWHNCGGRCCNKALVKDGVVIRQKTDDVYKDGEGGHFQSRSCQRGHAQQQQCFGADRLKYPMKRKNWQPGGGDNVNGELRGVDEWERIDWDEALDMVASEFARIYGEYGPRSAFYSGYAGGPMHNVMCSMGGYILADSTESYGNWLLATDAIGTTYVNYNPDIETGNDRLDLPNADTIVLYGCNPSWASGGSPSWHFWRAREAGTAFVYVGPSRNISASMLGARWIPVRPGTDTAFLLAVAYCMIQQEDDLVDIDFLHTYCVGYDAESMPDDARLDENFRGYVLGEYDGQPKTPQWATEICGTPVEDIEWYAQTVGKAHDVMLLHSYAAARTNGSENLPQLFLTIGCMGGHIGRSGNATGGAYHYESGNAGPRLIKAGTPRSKYVMNPVDDVIPGPEVWKAIADGHYTRAGYASGMSSTALVPAEERDIDVRLIVSTSNNFLQSKMNVNDGIRAHRRADFVLACDYKLSLSCQYADIVLPVSTRWEEYKPEQSTSWINRETQWFSSPVLEEPLFESHFDTWIGARLMERLGLSTEELLPISDKQGYYETIAGAKIFTGGKLMPTQKSTAVLSAISKAKAEGQEPDMSAYTEEWQPLVTITQEDIDNFGVEGTPQEGVIGFDELRKQGVYQVELTDEKRWIGYKDFIDDPENNPRPSRSGKFEIYSQAKADLLNGVGINQVEIKPYPNYIVPNEGYEASFDDWDSKTKGEYPFQMYTPHYARRSHTTLDNLPWLQEAFENPVFMNADDGRALGLQNGDTVLVSSKWGKVLRHVSLLESVMPGCIGVPHGVRSDFDEETGIDTGGSENTLLGPVMSNYFPHTSGYNSCLLKVEKYAEPIPYDYEKTFVPAI